MKRLLSILFTVGALFGAPAVYDVRQFGAAGDGKTKETAAIAKAIDACAKAGGGTVQFPAGKYLTGAITLRSNVTLRIDTGATILGSQDPRDYPLRDSPWGDGRKEISSLIYGADLENVAITGGGIIDGQGEIWWKRQWFAKEKKGHPPAKTPADFEEAKKVANGRPHLIKILRSKYVTIDGLRLTNSPSWTVNPVFCEFVTVHGVSIFNPVPSPNTDGINPESCRNVHISDCTIDVGDDCITLKSGTDEIGRKMGRPTENVTITNCTMLKGHGGVVIGSEMSGGVRNVSISNCVFQGTDKGLRIKSQRGRGGVVEGIAMSNVVMQDVPEAFTITMFYAGADTPEETYPVNEGTPRFRDILINNVTARGSKTAGQITGLREMDIASITFSNVRIQAQKGFTCHHAKDVWLNNVLIEPAQGPAWIGLTGRVCR
jgi:polygalacturonase